MENPLYPFLQKYWDQKSPLLIALSGGPDSKALLYYCLKLKETVPLHVAHLDHGWREESAKEAALLQEEVSRLGLPFHLKTSSARHSSNQEALAREERYSFFEELIGKYSMQAVLVAHHKDDLAETVLKRVFEGAHLPFLGAMAALQGNIWRPLLSLRKTDILEFLEREGLSFFQDRSNEDPRYLRTRMRQDIFPFLEEAFGKKIVENLALLSERSFEYREYLEKKSYPIFETSFGECLPASLLSRIEVRYWLQKKKKLSRDLLETILDAVYSWKSNSYCSGLVRVERGNIYFLRDKSRVCYEEP